MSPAEQFEFCLTEGGTELEKTSVKISPDYWGKFWWKKKLFHFGQFYDVTLLSGTSSEGQWEYRAGGREGE